MKPISFSMTKEAFLRGEKTVTRRLGWERLKPGEKLMGVEKAMGLKKGEKIVELGPLEVVGVRREPLSAILNEPDGVKAEGIHGVDAEEFVDVFCRKMGCRPDDLVTRIEFRVLFTPSAGPLFR